MVAGVGRTGSTYDVHASSLALFSKDVWKNNPKEGRQWNALAALRTLAVMGKRPARISYDPSADFDLPELFDHPLDQTLRGRFQALVRGLREDAAALLAAPANARRFAVELADFISRADLEDGDVVYLPTVLSTELRGLEHLLARSELARRLRWRLMLRYAPKARSVRSEMAASCHRLYRREDVDVCFSSDTEQLCRMYEVLCGAPIMLLPIPVCAELAPAEYEAGPLVIGYFGDARDEKGFNLLPSIIRHVREAAIDQRNIRFVVQMNLNTAEGDPRSRIARKYFQGQAGGDLELIEGPLAPDTYQNLIRTAHIVILPYEPSAYAERSSGVLMEALMAGAPCIVTSGSWMAAMIEAAEASSPAGEVVLADARAIAEGVLKIAADWSHYAQGARTLRDKLRPRADPSELVRLVTQKC